MSWLLLDSGTAVFADGNAGHVYNYPGGAPAAGNLLVVAVNSNTTVSTPSGYTLSPNASRVSNQGAYVFWRVAGGGEPSSVTVTTAGDHDTALSYRRYSGALASPFDVANNAGIDANSGTTTPALSLGPLAGTGELLLAYTMLHSWATEPTSPSWSGGPAQVAETVVGGAGATKAKHFVGQMTDASGTVNPSCSWTNAADERYLIAIAFQPGAEITGWVWEHSVRIG